MSRTADIEKACGRLIVGKVPGLSLDADSRRIFASGIASGVCLLKENASDIEQLSRLVREIRRLSTAAHGHVPHISVDQEGGAIQRFEHIICPLPGFMALAAQGDLDAISQVCRLNARQLGLLGFTMLLSPVLDLCQNPLNAIVCTRSLGDDPKTVGKLGAHIARQIASEGIVACGKHFPGHGSTLEDSHLCLAKDNSAPETLWHNQLAPFRKCARYLPAMLTGHIWLSSVDVEPLPASISANVSTGMLRKYLAYDGLVVTDDILMKAITERWGLNDAAVEAVRAGADQVLVCGNAEEIVSVHQALVLAVKSGRLSEARLGDALSHIDKTFDLLPFPYANSDQQLSLALEEVCALNKSESAKMLEISANAVAQLRGGIPDLSSGNLIVVAPDHPRYKLGLADFLKMQFEEQIRQGALKLNELRYALDPQADERKSILRFIEEIDAKANIVYLTYRSLLNKGQFRLGELIARTGCRRLQVACDTPYDILQMHDFDNCLATFDPSELAMEACSLVLSRKKEAKGTCPVKLECLVGT